jgi:hypothetical protein
VGQAAEKVLPGVLGMADAVTDTDPWVKSLGGTMLQTIEVEIDAKGHIHPLEKIPLPHKGKSRALLTILPAVRRRSSATIQENSAFGVLTASRSVSLDEMETAIHSRGSRL